MSLVHNKWVVCIYIRTKGYTSLWNNSNVFLRYKHETLKCLVKLSPRCSMEAHHMNSLHQWHHCLVGFWFNLVVPTDILMCQQGNKTQVTVTQQRLNFLPFKIVLRQSHFFLPTLKHYCDVESCDSGKNIEHNLFTKASYVSRNMEKNKPTTVLCIFIFSKLITESQSFDFVFS